MFSPFSPHCFLSLSSLNLSGSRSVSRLFCLTCFLSLSFWYFLFSVFFCLPCCALSCVPLQSCEKVGTETNVWCFETPPNFVLNIHLHFWHLSVKLLLWYFFVCSYFIYEVYSMHFFPVCMCFCFIFLMYICSWNIYCCILSKGINKTFGSFILLSINVQPACTQANLQSVKLPLTTLIVLHIFWYSNHASPLAHVAICSSAPCPPSLLHPPSWQRNHARGERQHHMRGRGFAHAIREVDAGSRRPDARGWYANWSQCSGADWCPPVQQLHLRGHVDARGDRGYGTDISQRWVPQIRTTWTKLTLGQLYERTEQDCFSGVVEH